ncbi:hypothetical protein F6W96_39415 [Nocardia terpenica]|uniref:IS30 family transposase n=1 Tax=Nocardia terpenica TaxID=455432 RepID=A0A6G9ZDQ6_9NOCA|nr:helix-turn-helix domain-containing protein [Nocardia terpenica]QIS23477.1 hypothetical protein F6W96_39415 [Nocardia terpenica]
MGLVSAARAAHGKPEAKARFLELVGQGWSTARAAREVGVHERTGEDWYSGVRRVHNSKTNARIHSDGTVVDYATGTRYKSAVSKISNDSPAPISDRYLSLHDRLAIANGLVVRQSLT